MIAFGLVIGGLAAVGPTSAYMLLYVAPPPGMLRHLLWHGALAAVSRSGATASAAVAGCLRLDLETRRR